jgi:hypothetical protein
MELGQARPADLPPARDDEPDGLRQDIADELADHLACGANRELLRGTDHSKIWRVVMERFGDPAAVARRLWLDAMKEKIMAQRVLIATCLIVTAACLALVGMFWMQANRAALDLAETNRRMVETLTENQATNRELLKQLQVMAKMTPAPAVSPSPTQPVPVVLKFTQESLGGPPAAGVKVVLSGGQLLTYRAMERITDQEGNADFGVVQPGDWEFMVSEEWDDAARSWHASGSFSVLPGAAVRKAIICPRAPATTDKVLIKVDWPANLKDKSLCLGAIFKHAGITYQPPLNWELNPGVSERQVKSILCGPGSAQTSIAENDPRFPSRDDSYAFGLPPPSVVDPGTGGIMPAGARRRVTSIISRAAEFEPGNYRLLRLLVLRQRRPAPSVEHDEAFELLAQAEVEVGYAYADGPGGLSDHKIAKVSLPDSYWRAVGARLQVKPGQVNEWTITLPDDLARAASEALTAPGTTQAPSSEPTTR